MLKESSLAKELSDIYTELCLKGECFIEINNWLKVNLLMNPAECILECFPYHTLLFHDNPKRLEAFFSDKSTGNILALLVKRCKFPIMSFKDLAEDEEIPFESVKEAALHFVRWNKAKLIPCVNSESVFVNKKDFLYTKSLRKEWERTFKIKEDEFLKILSLFSSPKSLKDIDTVFGKNKAIAIITWLLRKEIILDMHYRLYFLIIRPMPKTKYLDDLDLSSFDDQSAEFSTLESIYLYATGQNILEEIIWKSSKSFSEITECVKHFSNSLKMVLHYLGQLAKCFFSVAVNFF